MSFIPNSLSKALFVAALTLSFQATINAQNLSATLPNDPAVTTGKLANGLTYYIRNNHKPENKVELRLVVKAGSTLENEDQLGLAHFMEHMNFNGTKNFQKNDLVSYLQSIGVQFGADLNAYTSFDQTVYILPIPTDKPGNLEKGFQIIEDWAHNALLTDKDIDEERGVVLEESRLGKGADDRMSKRYFPKMAEGSIYGDRLPIGKDEILKNFKYNTIRSFYKDWYRPDLQAVVVVGDLDVATAKKMIEQHFAGIKNPAKERERTFSKPKPRTTPEAMVCTDKEASRTSLQIMFPSMEKRNGHTLADYRNFIKRSLIQSMFGHRLSDLVQSSNPPFPYAYAGVEGWMHGYESFALFTTFGGSGPEKAINAVTAEVIKARKFGFNESELEMARKEVMSSMEKTHNEMKTTESGNYVEEYIRAFLEGEDFPGTENEYKYHKDLLPGITVQELNNLFMGWVANMNTFSLITAPEKSDMKLPSEAELMDMVKKGFAQDIAKTEEKKVASSMMTTKPTAGIVTATTKEDGLDATTYTLSNGVKVTIRHTDFKSDEILMTGVKKGGTNAYGVVDRSNAHFATDLVESMGIGEFTPSDLEKVNAGKDIKFGTAMEETSVKVNGSSTIKDFESMLQLAYLTLTQPRKDEGLFNAYKEKQMMQLKFIMSNPQAAFFDTTIKTMYNNNPLARMVIPKQADYDNLNMDRAMEIYKNEIGCADGYHFFLVGNINAETALPLIETYLGSLPSKNTTPKVSDNGVRPYAGKKELKVHKGSDKKSMILAIYTGEVPFSEDLALKTSALSEVLNIKVIENMREKMGAIYGGGFNASLSKEPYGHYSIQLALPCGPENVDKLIAAAKEEIKNIKANGPEAKDVEKVKSQWREKHLTDVKENKYWAGKLEGVLFWGRDKNRMLKYQETVDKLTPAEIKQTANLLFDGKNEFISVLYPES